MKNKVLMLEMDRAPVTATEVASETNKDCLLSKVREYVLSGWPEGEYSGEMLSYHKKASKLSGDEGVI